MKNPLLAVLSLSALALAGAACSSAGRPSPEGGGAPAAGPAGASAPASADDAAIRFIEPSKDYPLETCVVSGEDLTVDGKPVALTYRGEEVQFCCSDCVAEFRKDPEKYLARVRAAKAAKAAGTPK